MRTLSLFFFFLDIGFDTGSGLKFFRALRMGEKSIPQKR